MPVGEDLKNFPDIHDHQGSAHHTR